MTRPRRPLKSKPQLDAMEQRLVLSQTTAAAAPVAEAVANRPPAMVRLLQQQRRPINAEPLAQIRIQANQEPAGPQAARAVQREEMRLQREQRREQAREQRSLAAAANPAPAYKVHASSTDTGGFSFSKVWKSIFPW